MLHLISYGSVAQEFGFTKSEFTRSAIQAPSALSRRWLQARLMAGSSPNSTFIRVLGANPGPANMDGLRNFAAVGINGSYA